jgi:predicted nuclease of predicted toxin-antitoxin system
VIRFLADENLDYDIVRGLWRRRPDLDVRSIREAGLLGQGDPEVLAFAATEGRVVLTHDARTMTRFAIDRVAAGEPMPGLVVITAAASLREAIDGLLLIVECGVADDLRDHVVYLPL